MTIRELIVQLNKVPLYNQDKEIIVELEPNETYVALTGELAVLDTDSGMFIALVIKPIES